MTFPEEHRHELTQEERAKGGSRTKYNRLLHGRRSELLGKKYICPNCNTAITTDLILDQDALMAKLATKDSIYSEMKANLVKLQSLCESEENLRAMFAMQVKINEQLMALYEKAREEPKKKEGDITIPELMRRINLLDDTKPSERHLSRSSNSNQVTVP